jgi:tight adherence protein C
VEVLAAIFFATAIFVSARVLMNRAPSVTQARLDMLAAPSAAQAAADPGLSQRLVQPFVRSVMRRMAAVLPEHTGQWLQAEIAAAGLTLRAGTFVTIVACTTLGLGGFTAMSAASDQALSPRLELLLVAGASAIGFAAPIVWLRGRVARRGLAIQQALPDTLDLIVVSVEAGLGFEAALARITDQAEGPLAEELRHVLSDMNLGISRREALQAMALRARTHGVSSLVTAILQAERTGMSVGGVLRNQASHVRMLRRQRAEEAAMKAPLKMLFPLIFFIFPSLFVVVLGPAVLNLMRTLGGEP